VNGTEHPFDIALLSCRRDKENILGRKLIACHTDGLHCVEKVMLLLVLHTCTGERIENHGPMLEAQLTWSDQCF
jgi:hypothetical protein